MFESEWTSTSWFRVRTHHTSTLWINYETTQPIADLLVTFKKEFALFTNLFTQHSETPSREF